MFDLLYGNLSFKSELALFIRNGTLPQSIIVEGEEGLGKHVAASLLAAAAECEEPNGPCMTCKQCRLALALQHPDVRLWSPTKSVFSVDLAREIRNAAYVKPMTARTNIQILEHCERMNAEAQNALLKILEEPPSDAMFILLTENAGVFLPTVLSRCTLLRLTPVEDDEMIRYLQTKGIGEEECRSISALADGNIGKASELCGSAEMQELQNASDDLFRGFASGKELDLLKLVCRHEKSNDLIRILYLFRDTLRTELRKAIGHESRRAAKQYTAAIEAVNRATEAIAANANKTLTLALLCSDLKEAGK